ncbi:hypothetical protein AAFF_G00043580 [Aldrovandia affinis]|uniref:Uncharacterized protein n=1 Tax=Aldrovandia affinis TaxID=143900 RepID=A0AAD7R2M6_9TELE|nr:hypothetical protein AAFF_G00043580 [Aldrovandia affinis]
MSHKSIAHSSHHSSAPCIADKRADAAADLAAKEVEYEVLLEEETKGKDTTETVAISRDAFYEMLVARKKKVLSMRKH